MDSLCCQVNQFQQCHFVRKSTFGFGYLTDLAVIAFDRIGRVNQLPYRLSICKPSTNPVFPNPNLAFSFASGSNTCPGKALHYTLPRWQNLLVYRKPSTNPAASTEEITYTRKKKSNEKHPGRFPLPDHLPVKEIILEPKEDTSELKCIGQEITEKLELVPAKLFIKRYIRPKYIKPEDENDLSCKGVIAELPSFPIEKGIAGAGLLAQIAV